MLSANILKHPGQGVFLGRSPSAARTRLALQVDSAPVEATSQLDSATVAPDDGLTPDTSASNACGTFVAGDRASKHSSNLLGKGSSGGTSVIVM